MRRIILIVALFVLCAIGVLSDSKGVTMSGSSEEWDGLFIRVNWVYQNPTNDTYRITRAMAWVQEKRGVILSQTQLTYDTTKMPLLGPGVTLTFTASCYVEDPVNLGATQFALGAEPIYREHVPEGSQK